MRNVILSRQLGTEKMGARKRISSFAALPIWAAIAWIALGEVSCSAEPQAKPATAETVKADAQSIQEFPIWPGVASGSENWTQQQNDVSLPSAHVVYNVVRPTLTAYFADPKTATGAVMIVAPGGGFRFLQIDNEGTEVARALAARGITTFVLKYRTEKMPDSTPGFLLAAMRFLSQLKDLTDRGAKGEIMLAGGPDTTRSLAPDNILNWPFYGAADGVQAMKIVRANAAKWNLDPHRIGFMGFSAGAMVTYGVITTADPANMPDIAAPLYFSLASNVPIPPNAPPLFMAAASDDPISRGMPATYMRWIAAGHSAELHMWAKGGHGFGMSKQGAPTDNWIDTYCRWLDAEGFLKRR